MKLKLTFFLGLILLFLNVKAQTFSDSYFNLFKESWEKEPTEEMRAQVDPSLDSLYRRSTGKGFWEMQTELLKQSTITNLENYKAVFKLKGIDIDEKNRLIIIEESSNSANWPPDLTRKGFVIVDDQTFTYRFDPNEEVQYDLDSGFLDRNQIYFDSRKIITDLAKSYDIDELGKLAKMEMELENVQPKVQYEIVVYDQNSEKPLRIIYLHDFITELEEK